MDDPTLDSFDGVELNGRTVWMMRGFMVNLIIVKDGVLQGFLMGRSLIEGFPTSMDMAGGKQGMEPSLDRETDCIRKKPSRTGFKNALIREINAQNKPFGLIFEDISGGFTFTGRNSPNSYVVKPVTVWRVYPDGHEEMVRGVDMIGTR